MGEGKKKPLDWGGIVGRGGGSNSGRGRRKISGGGTTVKENLREKVIQGGITDIRGGKNNRHVVDNNEQTRLS